MVLEYLFFDKNQRQNVEAYNHELETSDTGNGKNSSGIPYLLYEAGH